jgi:Uma2 family endonuclease
MIATMTALSKPRMNVDQFLAWAAEQPGRYELFNGEVYAMSPEGAGHAEIKFAVQIALATAIRARGLPCHVLPDGMTVRVEEATAHEPDALVYCGPELAPSALEVPNPVIVVEVLSPSPCRIGPTVKLPGYFRLPSVAHYLIVDSGKPMVVHHARGTEDTIVTRIVTEGSITLDPPGLELALADVYGAAQP